jgi:hypothetical protein
VSDEPDAGLMVLTWTFIFKSHYTGGLSSIAADETKTPITTTDRFLVDAFAALSTGAFDL